MEIFEILLPLKRSLLHKQMHTHTHTVQHTFTFITWMWRMKHQLARVGKTNTSQCYGFSVCTFYINNNYTLGSPVRSVWWSVCTVYTYLLCINEVGTAIFLLVLVLSGQEICSVLILTRNEWASLFNPFNGPKTYLIYRNKMVCFNYLKK